NLIRDQRGQFYFAICKVKGVNFIMPLTTRLPVQINKNIYIGTLGTGIGGAVRIRMSGTLI
ncbi:hypothetical protein NQ652_18460, partial [Acinetobacter baumannii]|nr:hypothetical protein [Acinetobacter baumannii]